MRVDVESNGLCVSQGNEKHGAAFVPRGGPQLEINDDFFAIAFGAQQPQSSHRALDGGPKDSAGPRGFMLRPESFEEGQPQYLPELPAPGAKCVLIEATYAAKLIQEDYFRPTNAGTVTHT